MTELFNQEYQTTRRKILRNNSPLSEWKLWMHLKAKRLDGFRFRRQFGIGPYVADFYCPSVQIIIEVDGDSHYGPGAQEQDAVRQQFIEDRGIKVLRFTNNEIRDNLEAVLEKIRECLRGRRPPLTPPS